MKMYELEQKLNEKIAELGLNTKEHQTYYNNTAEQLVSIVKDIVKFELFGSKGENIYVTTYKGNIVIRTFGFSDIIVKVRRTKGDNIYNYGSIQYYYINKVEIDYPNMKETLDKWYDTNKQLYDEKNQEDNNKVNSFINFLQDNNITLEDFKLYDGIYRVYGYKIRRTLEKE